MEFSGIENYLLEVPIVREKDFNHFEVNGVIVGHTVQERALIVNVRIKYGGLILVCLWYFYLEIKYKF